MSFGTWQFLALSRHSVNILESLKCELIQFFFLKGSKDQVCRRMKGVTEGATEMGAEREN
jgi:hypothetical protein